MTTQKQARLLSAATSLALIFSILFTSTVFADDSTNPPVEETVTPPVEQPITDTPTVSELLEELPENTNLVVTVEDQIVPLATNEAATAILQGDPIWCPEGSSPTPSANGCTASYAKLEDLIDDIDSSYIPEPTANGTIWITSGSDASIYDIVIDGSLHKNWSNYTLTLQGGWSGSSAGDITGVSNFSVPISVINWNNTVSVNNINISNKSSTGLEVSTSGDISLDNVTMDINNGNGADLNSTSGDISISGTNSFSGNNDSGLLATTKNGGITVGNVTASNNAGNGAELYSSNNVTVTGTNTFNGNTYSGLYVESNSDIQTEDVSANNNGGNGAELYAQGSVTLTGNNTYSDNVYSGLYVESNGDINVQNITATGNGWTGAELYTHSHIRVTGINLFENNYDAGLYLESGVDIYVENVSSNSNQGNGLDILSSGMVTLDGTNIFLKNKYDGVYIDAVGNILIYNTTSSENGYNGIYLGSNGSAIITCSVLLDNPDYAVEADLSGTLTLNGFDFGGNLDAIGANPIFLNSNQCFTYPVSPVKSHNNTINISSGSNNSFGTVKLPVNEVQSSYGQRIPLDCGLYQGTVITFLNGDGVFIPCPIIDSAQLMETTGDNLPQSLPGTNSYVSSLLVTILKNDQQLVPNNIPGSFWYENSKQDSGMQAFYWDGTNWVEFTDQITPFINVFFKIPDDLKDADLAILYWDQTQWVELSESQYLGNGYIVKTGGHVRDDGMYFEATVNFTGTFVLVKK